MITVEERTEEARGEIRRELKQSDIEFLFPQKVIKSCEDEDYAQKIPRDGVVFEHVYYPPSPLSEDGCPVWRFSKIAVKPNETASFDLPPFVIDLHYFGGQDDARLLFEILMVVGKPKNEENVSGVKFFLIQLLIYALGVDYFSRDVRDTDKFELTEQFSFFRKALFAGYLPLLILLGHGGGGERKILGTKGGFEGVFMDAYLRQIDVARYAAIVDLSCTFNPQFCLETLPGLLPENCPPFFGSLEKIHVGLGYSVPDTYCIYNHRVAVFRK